MILLLYWLYQILHLGWVTSTCIFDVSIYENLLTARLSTRASLFKLVPNMSKIHHIKFAIVNAPRAFKTTRSLFQRDTECQLNDRKCLKRTEHRFRIPKDQNTVTGASSPDNKSNRCDEAFTRLKLTGEERTGVSRFLQLHRRRKNVVKQFLSSPLWQTPPNPKKG